MLPCGLTIALSREAGARGGAIGRRVGQKLGWQVFDQELLEYMAQDGVVRQGVLDAMKPAATVWAEERLQQLLREQNLSQNPAILTLARVVLALGAGRSGDDRQRLWLYFAPGLHAARPARGSA